MAWLSALKNKKLFVALLLLLSMLFIVSGCSETTNDTETNTDQNGDAGNPTVVEADANKAPDFTLIGLDGEMHTLSDYQGSPVLLNFWATWCGPCRSEMPDLDAVYADWKDKGLVMLAVNAGEKESTVREFLNEYGYSMPVLLDPDHEVTSKYYITGIPTTYFIDEDGIIFDKVIGAFQTEEQIEQYLNKLTD